MSVILTMTFYFIPVLHCTIHIYALYTQPKGPATHVRSMAVDQRSGVAVGESHWNTGTSEPTNRFHSSNTYDTMGSAYRHEQRGDTHVHDPSKRVLHTAAHTTSPNKVVTGPAGLAKSGPMYAGEYLYICVCVLYLKE